MSNAPHPPLNPLPRLIFASRWLQLPLYLGLIVAQGVYVFLFLKELWHLIHDAAALSEQQINQFMTAERTAQARLYAQRAQANVQAMEATVQRIAVELADSELKAPRDGRVQFLIAHPGEIVAAGGRVLQLIDLADVYMTFFLPETVAGRVALGSEVRIVLDAAPQYVIPARVSFVASTAQFTPKTVETASERQKLMFRVRAQIDRELLQRHIEQVKTGLPGVAWVRIDPQAPWPERLALPRQP